MARSKTNLIIGGIITISIVLVFILFKLPKSVVENDVSTITETTTTDDNKDSHTTALPDSVVELVASLKASIDTASDQCYEVNKLALAFENQFLYDSSAQYLQKYCEEERISERLAYLYFRSFEIEQIPEQKMEKALRAKEAYAQLENKDSAVALVNYAVLIVSTEQPPLKGINLLKGIINNNPENTYARLKLGEFLFTIGRDAKAATQFRAISKLEWNLKAEVMLTECYLNIGNNEKARKQVNKLQQLENKDAFLEQYIQEKLNALNAE